MGCVFVICCAALAGAGWFWSVSDFPALFFIVLTFTVLMFPMGLKQDSPRFCAVWQVICTSVGCVLAVVLEDKVIGYSIIFTALVVIAIYKMLPLLNGDFFDVYVNNEPVMIDEKLYNIIDKDMSEGLRAAVLIPVIGFYCALMAPYVACPEYPWLAALPPLFVLYRAVRIFQMTS